MLSALIMFYVSKRLHIMKEITYGTLEIYETIWKTFISFAFVIVEIIQNVKIHVVCRFNPINSSLTE